LGLATEFPDDALTVIVNTGDDLDLFGLHVSPDLDTVMYTLAGMANPETGWGLSGDTFQALEMLARYGQPDWFRVGDRDLATHLMRTSLLRSGLSLTEVTETLRKSLGVRPRIIPMCNESVRTWIRLDAGWLPFQEYFVLRGYADPPLEVEHRQVEAAAIDDEVREAILSAGVIVVAPSNPVVSIGPILAIPGVQGLLKSAAASKVGVSPIVGGEAVSGPAAQLMRAVALEPSASGVAAAYASFLDLLVVDSRDPDAVSQVEATGMRAASTDTLMPDLESKRRLARFVVEAVG
ncbi:MAG TPA: 2-phospho-L-lactate transferase, partial [Chloroflexota bacterium]|nr:2-phospho-L-lactate transferase [Chloroflexota bacterium]